jgi:hypothetical protein
VKKRNRTPIHHQKKASWSALSNNHPLYFGGIDEPNQDNDCIALSIQAPNTSDEDTSSKSRSLNVQDMAQTMVRSNRTQSPFSSVVKLSKLSNHDEDHMLIKEI